MKRKILVIILLVLILMVSFQVFMPAYAEKCGVKVCKTLWYYPPGSPIPYPYTVCWWESCGDSIDGIVLYCGLYQQGQAV